MSALDRFVVVDKSAKMPNSCWGIYRRVGVVELTAEAQREGSFPKMLSKRAHAVHRVVDVWEDCNVGTTDRCAYRRAVVEADELARDLNKVARYLPRAATVPAIEAARRVIESAGGSNGEI